LHGIDKGSGKIRWQIADNWFGRGELHPILIDGNILYAIEPIADDHVPPLLAIADSSSGKTVRTISIPHPAQLIPAIRGDFLFFADHVANDQSSIRHLNCLNLESGKIVWSRKDYNVGSISEIAFDNGLVFESFQDSLRALDERTGAVRWRSQVGASMNPLLVEGANVIALQTLKQISYKGLSPRAASINITFVDPATGQTKYGTVANVLTLPVFKGTEM